MKKVFRLNRIVALFVILTCVSCKSNKIIDCEYNPDMSALKIEIENPAVYDTTITVSDLVSNSYKIVQLDSLRKVVIGKVVKVQISSGYIFVLDKNKKLFQFDTSGKFLRTIGEKEKSSAQKAKEDFEITDWIYENEGKKHLIWNQWTKELLTYNINGDLIKKEKLDGLYSSNIQILNKDVLIFYADFNPANNSRANLLYYDRNSGEFLKGFWPFKPLKPKTFYTSSFPFFRNGTKSYYYNTYSYTTYELSDSCPSPYYHFTGDPNLFWAKNILESKNESTRLDEMGRPACVFPFSSYCDSQFVYMDYSFNSRIVNLFYDLASKKVLFKFNSIIFDLPNLKDILCYELLFSDRDLIFPIYPGVIYDQMSEVEKKKLQLKEGYQDFKERYDISSNPILVICNYNPQKR